MARRLLMSFGWLAMSKKRTFGYSVSDRTTHAGPEPVILLTREGFRWVCAGTFPPKRAGGGRGWLRSDIEQLTGLARLGVKVEVAERVLNHARERMEATCDVHHYTDEKRAALEKRAKHLADLRDAESSA